MNRDKPNLIRSMQLPPIREQLYERYLPTAFDESLSMIEKINKVIYYLHAYSKITEDMLGNWNEVYRWVMNEGLDSTVTQRIRELLDDGTFDRIINKEIFGELNKKVDGVIDKLDGMVSQLENMISEAKDEMDKQISLMKEEVHEMTKYFTKIVVSPNQPSETPKNTYWYEVIE